MEETILGINVSAYNYDELMHRLLSRIETNQKSSIIAVNPEKVIKSQKDQELRHLINESTFKIPDGIGVVLASKLGENKIKSRVTGIDTMDQIIKLAANQGLKVYFYGAKPETLELAVNNIKSNNPNLNVVGYQHGYIKDEKALIRSINDVKADILFVALGSPKQELWIKKNSHRLNTVKVFQGVGGSFDVYSGNVARAPKLFRQTGTEWLYRLVTDPKRLKRQLALPKFLIKVLLNKKGRRQKS